MYKVQNKLNSPVKLGDLVFQPNETKLLEEKPYSDKFYIEKIEEPKNTKKEEKN